MMQKNVYKYRLKLTKKDELSYISHLDWQNLILKIFRRMVLPLVLSEGFNKMPRVSYSPALPIFLESSCELVDFLVYEPIKDNFKEEFRKNSPNGIRLIEILKPNDDEPKSLENYIQRAKYEAIVEDEKKHVYNLEKIRYIIEKCLASNELLILKKTKKGIEKQVNYRNSLKFFDVNQEGRITFILKAGQNQEIPALRADDFLRKVFDEDCIFKIKRIEFYDKSLRSL